MTTLDSLLALGGGHAIPRAYLGRRRVVVIPIAGFGHHNHHYYQQEQQHPHRRILHHASSGSNSKVDRPPGPAPQLLKAYSVDGQHSAPPPCNAPGSGSAPQRLRQRSVSGSSRRTSARTADDIFKISRIQTAYELSQDLLDKQVEFLERKYGGQVRARNAALTIQRAFRKHCMLRKFADITSYKGEKRLSRRLGVGHAQGSSPNDASSCSPFADSATIKNNLEALVKELAETLHEERPPRPVRSLSMREKSVMGVSRAGQGEGTGTPNGRGQHRKHRRHVEDGDDYGDDEEGGVEGESGGVAMRRVGVFSMGTPTSHRDRRSMPACGGGAGGKRPPPPEVPKRTSSIRGGQQPPTHLHLHLLHQHLHHQQQHQQQQQMMMTKCEPTSSPDAASLSSAHSSGSDCSLTGSSGADVPAPHTPSKPVDGSSPVLHDVHHQAALILEDKRLSNISENSEDSLEGVGYRLSPPTSFGGGMGLGMLGHSHSHLMHVNHTPCPTPCPTPTTMEASKVPEVVRKRQYRVGLNLFNKKPEKGIRYLMQRGFLENSSQAVARFLNSRKGLSRQMIGEFLGNLQNPFNMETLECFANEIDLAGMQVDVALRKFQYHFRMPGEAQKIERIVEVFSHRYCDCNRDIVVKFRSADTVFIMAFAVIMLNTDLHTPNIKPERRMKVEDFIKNLRGIDEGADVEREMLVGIYERIKATEFRPGHDHVTQVMKVQQTIVGKKPVSHEYKVLALPHRRLVCYCRLYEVHDATKKDRQGAHQREVFLFNDLLVVTKILSKKKNSVTYTFRQSYPLCGLQVLGFEFPHYQHGIRLVQKVDSKVLITFNARNEHDCTKFMEDLRESILEMDEMENLRIESELEKQKLARSRATENRDSGVADMELPTINLNNSPNNVKDPKLLTLTNPDCGVLKRSALSNSLLDIHEQTEKPQRRGSSGSLDSGMSISFQSSAASSASRDSSPHQNGKGPQSGFQGSKGSGVSHQPGFLGGLFAKKTKSSAKCCPSRDCTEV